MTNEQRKKIENLIRKIRNKELGTSSLFLAMAETYPQGIWLEAEQEGLMSGRERAACLCVWKQYRKLQAKSAIKQALN